MASLSVNQLFNRYAAHLRLEWLAGKAGGEKALQVSSDDRISNCAPVGYLNLIHPHQIQIIGRQECHYLGTLSAREYAAALQRLAQERHLHGLILSDACPASDAFITLAEQHNIPLLRSKLSARKLLRQMHALFAELMVERTSLHGVFMDVLGMGVLITGASGTGKSELALELISRGHRLVADDCAEFTRLTPSIINGSSPLGLSGFMEVRGLGILNVPMMFGDSAIKAAKYLRLIIHLEMMDADRLRQLDRLDGDYQTRKVLGLHIPQITLPIAPGRNLAVLVECAVRNHSLRMQGYNAVDDFSRRQQQAMRTDMR